MYKKGYSRPKTKTTRKKSSFAGADHVYLTKKSIAVKRISSSRDVRGNSVYSTRTTYLPKTTTNLAEANRQGFRPKYK